MERINCHKCSSIIDDNSKFCKYCGTKVKKGCPLCGELLFPEDIKRGFCSEKLTAIQNKKQTYLESNLSWFARWFYDIHSALLLWLIIGAFLVVLLLFLNKAVPSLMDLLNSGVSATHAFIVTAIVFATVLIFSIVTCLINQKKSKRVEESFAKTYPEDEAYLKEMS